MDLMLASLARLFHLAAIRPDKSRGPGTSRWMADRAKYGISSMGSAEPEESLNATRIDIRLRFYTGTICFSSGCARRRDPNVMLSHVADPSADKLRWTATGRIASLTRTA
jgi:hypothetical protein